MTQIPAQSNSAKQQSAAADLNGQPPVTLNSGSPDSGALNPSTPNPGKPVSASKIPLAPIQSMPPIPVVVNANALEMSQFDYYGTPPERRRSRMQAALNPSTGEPTASPSNSARSRFVKRWNNLGTRRKLLLLVLFSSALPTLVMTQALVSLNRGRAIADAKTAATQQAGAFRDEYVLWAEGDAASKASNLARLITATNVDVNDARSLSANASSLKTWRRSIRSPIPKRPKASKLSSMPRVKPLPKTCGYSQLQGRFPPRRKLPSPTARQSRSRCPWA
ncbi:MAG: hypothetical protein HC857_17220 [Synechococcales cyanobacterium RU_4_20]|nr:hypothetical protein [Synechococcales cyanobacterium RU_4_20]